MTARYLAAALVLAAAGAAAGAVEVDVYGHLYGAVTGDFNEGAVEPRVLPAPLDPGDPAYPEISLDGDAAYNIRYEADVGVKAEFAENIAGNVLFTFDDRKQLDSYRYDLLSTGGVYHLAEYEERRYVYGSLEQVTLELADLAWDTDVVLGGYDIRYGYGGYYNALVNRIDPTSFVAYLDPFGARAARQFGPLSSTLEAGVGTSRQPIVATSHRLGGMAVFAAAEGRSYDVKSIRDTHLSAALPPYWRYRYDLDGVLAAAPLADPAKISNTIHGGAEYSLVRDKSDLYVVAAYHRFGDDAEIAEDPTGGSLIQVYPDAGVNVAGPRLWVRAAALYEMWRANYHSAFGDDVSEDAYAMAFVEPQFYLLDNLFVGVGGRIINPTWNTKDDAGTLVRENNAASVAVIPHLSYAPAEGVKVDLTYTDAQWDPSYDVPDTDFTENRARNFKLEIEAVF